MQRIVISENDISLDSTMAELLGYLASVPELGGSATVDVEGTDMEFVTHTLCAHCMGEIPVGLPRRMVSGEAEYCERCSAYVPHSYDAQEALLVTAARYSLDFFKDLHGTDLKSLGFLHGQSFRVWDSKGEAWEAVIF